MRIFHLMGSGGKHIVRRLSWPILTASLCLPAVSYGQCVRISGTNQIVCPAYGQSSVPVSVSPGYRVGPGAFPAAQVGAYGAEAFVGAASVAATHGRAFPAYVPLVQGGLGVAQNYRAAGQPWVVQQPPRAQFAPRPAGCNAHWVGNQLRC